MILARFWMRADSFFELKFDKVIMNSNTTKTLKQKNMQIDDPMSHKKEKGVLSLGVLTKLFVTVILGEDFGEIQ